LKMYSNLINHYSMSQSALDNNGWSLVEDHAQALIDKMKAHGIPLEEYVCGKIYNGIKTGLNKAFIIDKSIRKQLINESSKNEAIIKPFLAGKDIKRYHSPDVSRYLIFIPWHFPLHNNPGIISASNEAESLFREEYPSIYAYMENFKSKLSMRDRKETGIRYEWYALQRFRPNYCQEFEKPKIIYPNICKKPEFTLDENSLYTNQKSYIIPLGDKYLLGILNSSVIYFIFKSTLPLLRGGFFEPGHMFVKEIPLPKIDLVDPRNMARHDRMVSLVEQMLVLHKQLPQARTPHEQTALERQIEAADRQIDALVYELYGLTEEEIAIVEGGKRA